MWLTSFFPLKSPSAVVKATTTFHHHYYYDILLTGLSSLTFAFPATHSPHSSPNNICFVGLWKTCVNSTKEFPYILHSGFPDVSILYNHSTLIKTRKFTLVQYYYLNYMPYSNFSSFPTVLFSFRILCRFSHDIQLLFLLNLLPSIKVPHSFLIFHDLDTVKEY